MTQQERQANKTARRDNNTFSQFDDTFNEYEVKRYHDYQDNRKQAIALLEKLKTKQMRLGGMQASKVIWKDAQPTLVETTRYDGKFKTDGANLSASSPADGMLDRVPSAWEAKLDRKRRRQYTLAETPTMTFKSSGHLPAEYYQEEEQLEAYINSLEKEKNNAK